MTTPDTGASTPAITARGAASSIASIVTDNSETAQVYAKVMVDFHALLSRITELEASAREVLSFRVGEQPYKGWLRDNNSSRCALTALARTLVSGEKLELRESIARTIDPRAWEEYHGAGYERKAWLEGAKESALAGADQIIRRGEKL